MGSGLMSSAPGYAAGIVVLVSTAAFAKKHRALDARGVAVALAMGLILLASSWVVLTLMMTFFVSSSALTLLKYREKERLGVAERRGGRSASQVLCSGAVPTALAALSALLPERGVQLLFAAAAAIAYANADTWASEIGSLSRSQPHLVVNPRVKVPPGVSGGITLLGEAGAAGGAALVAAIYALLSGAAPAAVFALGWAGEVVDAVIGALLQPKYFCPRCRVLWDHPTHVCGAETRYVRGFRWLKNEHTNLVTGLVVASAALLTSPCL